MTDLPQHQGGHPLSAPKASPAIAPTLSASVSAMLHYEVAVLECQRIINMLPDIADRAYGTMHLDEVANTIRRNFRAACRGVVG